jgi:hypothetical protein
MCIGPFSSQTAAKEGLPSSFKHALVNAWNSHFGAEE